MEGYKPSKKYKKKKKNETDGDYKTVTAKGGWNNQYCPEHHLYSKELVLFDGYKLLKKFSGEGRYYCPDSKLIQIDLI